MYSNFIDRYASDTFGYAIPTPVDGDYVLVLRFAEVYWRFVI